MRDIIGVGASAGGVAALTQLLSGLPEDLPATVLVVLHRSPDNTSFLPDILRRSSKLKVSIAQDGDPLLHGRCYVGTTNNHLILGKDQRIHFVPDGFYRSHNIDVLFCSLARQAGTRSIGVILSGLLKDGAMGLKAIKEAGGRALVQCPEEAAYRDMPESAIALVGTVDYVGPISSLALEIRRLVREHEFING